MEYIPIRVSDIIRLINRDIYLPAIQREFVWGTDRIERHRYGGMPSYR